MAIKTQIKVAQLTGSIPTSGESASAASSIVTADLGGLMKHMASAIKRIHGGSDFSSAAAGEFAIALKTDDIQEKTSNHGVEIDGVLIKDNDIAFPADASTIGSSTTVDLLTFNANDVQVKAAKTLKVDTIAESASAAGVTIDGVLIKDNDIVIPDAATIGSTSAPTAMTVGADGVVAFVDDIKIKDGGTIGVASTVDAMTISSAGIVTFKDDILLKNAGTIGNAAQADGITLKADGNIQIKGAKDLLVDEILESSSGVGVTIDGVLLKDNDVVVPNGSTIGSVGVPAAITFGAGSGQTPSEVVLHHAKVNQDLYVVDDLSVSGSITAGAAESIAVGTSVLSDDSLVMTPSSGDTVSITAAADGALTIATSDAAGTAADVSITADGQMEFRANDAAGFIFDIAGTDQVTLTDGVLAPVTDSDVDLGTNSLRFKDAFVDSATVTAGITVGGDAVITGNLTVNGTTTQVDTTNLQVKDKNILINDGGGSSSAGGAGFDIEENGSVAGFIKVAADRAGFELQAPGNSNTLTIDATTSAPVISVGGDLTVESASIINQDVSSDATPTFAGATLSAGPLAVNAQGQVQFKDSDSSNYVAIRSPGTVASNVTLTLPVNAGSSGQALLTDGSGNLSFGAPSAGAIAADDIAVGDAAISIKSSAANTKLELDATTGASVIALSASMGIKLNPGGLNMDIMRPIDANFNSVQSGFISAQAGQIGDSLESLTINGQDNLYLSSSLGRALFVGKSQFGAAQPYFLIQSGTNGQAILSGTQHASSVEFHGNSAAEMFRVHHTNGVSIPSAKSFSFNGDTNTMKISANGGNEFNIMGPDKIVVDANAGIELNSDSGTIEMKDASANLFTFNAAGIANGSGDLALDVVGDIELNADGGNITLKDGSDTMVDFVANGTTYVTLDAPGDIRLDAGGMDVNLLAGGTEFGRLSNDGSSNFALFSAVSDKDMLFKGNDGGSTITALTLDMSEGGTASFLSTVSATEFIRGNTRMSDGAITTIGGSTNITLDSGADIVLDADGDNITMKAGSDASSGLDFKWDNGSSLWKIDSNESESSIVLSARGSGSTAVEAMRVSGEGSSSAKVVLPSGIQMQFGGNQTRVQGDNTSLTLAAGSSGFIFADAAVQVRNNNGLQILDIGAGNPTTPGSGYGKFYVKNDTPFFMSDAGTAFNLTTATVTGSHPVKVQHSVSGTIAAEALLDISAGVGFADWLATGGHGNSEPNLCDVFVNGQLLVSGTAGSLTNADYVLVNDPTNNKLKFSFGLEKDDVVTVRRIRKA